MATTRVFVPGLRKSNGMSEFKPAVPGEYVLECTKLEIKDPKNPQPAKNWVFSWKVLDGPLQENGKALKTFRSQIYMKEEAHPQFNPDDDMGLDELKSIIIAGGVSISKDDGVNPEAFVGIRVKVYIRQEPDKNDPSKIWNRISSYKPAE